MPGAVESDDESVVELRTDFRIPFAINFVACERFHARTARALIENQLRVFDLNVDLSGPDFRAGHVRKREALTQVRMLGRVFQIAGSLRGNWFTGSIHADELAQAQI